MLRQARGPGCCCATHLLKVRRSHPTLVVHLDSHAERGVLAHAQRDCGQSALAKDLLSFQLICAPVILRSVLLLAKAVAALRGHTGGDSSPSSRAPARLSRAAACFQDGPRHHWRR